MLLVEFRSINTAIDQLQAVLDSLETRNAGIHEELLELLRSNREIREALQEEDTDNEGSEESCQKEPSQKGTAEESGKHTTASDELSSLCDVQLRVEDKCDS